MLKRRARFFNLSWRVMDLTINVLSFFAAYHLRFTFLPRRSPSIPQLHNFTSNLIVLLVLWVVWAEIYGLYTSKRLNSPAVDWKPIFYTVFSSIFSYSALGFLFKTLDASRYLLAVYSFTVVISIGLWHQFIRSFLSQARRKGYNKRQLLIVGAGEVGLRLARHIEMHPEFGFCVVGFLDDHRRNGDLKKFQYEILGNTSRLMDTIRKKRIDRVMIALPLSKVSKIAEITDVCEYEGVEVNIIPDLFRFVKPSTKVFEIDGMPVIGVRRTPVDSWQYIYAKRAFDIVFSLFAILLTSPVWVITSVLIKLTSKGPVLFKQTRIGTNGKEFEFYKFRTMRLAPKEESDKLWTTPNDGRRTIIGKFLRKTSIDELPQFWNVLRGDMSVVGPRPERPHFARKFQQSVPKYMVRHQVRTGITGWAQVNGFRGDTSIPKRVEYDLFYIENWSFWFDLKIIWLTIWKGMVGNNAY